MNVTVELENCCSATGLPETARVAHWAETALRMADHDGETAEALELSIRIVDETESARLNHHYRQKDHATNVLSFTSALPAEVNRLLPRCPLGDLAICAAVIEREARQQNKALTAHWAHMIVHGVLHLLGYDHQDDAEAEVMESLEIRTLEQLGYPDPYQSPVQA